MRNYKIKTFNASTRILRRLEHPTMRFIMWLMLVSVLLVFAMTPILDANRKGTLNAGQTDTGVQYTSAPWVQVNNGTALFTSGSGINATTLYDLLSKVNQTSVWESYKTENSNAYLSAKNFGKLNGTNAQLQVQLFDSAILGTISTANNTNLNIDGATSVLWQAVYRSMGSTGDVLTLYMNDIYCDDVYFDNTSPYYGYYKDSNLREVAQGTYTALKNKYTTLDIYTVLPQNVPGQWQSSDNQTGSDKTQSSYASGASKAYSSASYDAINNGLDDFGTKHTSWTNSSTTTTTPYNNDKLWVPSNYEVIYKDNTTDGSTSYVSSYSSVDATLTNGTSGGSDGENDGRSGLWELSGYDRASGSWAWLRSGYSDSGSRARAVH